MAGIAPGLRPPVPWQPSQEALRIAARLSSSAWTGTKSKLAESKINWLISRIEVRIALIPVMFLALPARGSPAGRY
jgi:hypothetical protein